MALKWILNKTDDCVAYLFSTLSGHFVNEPVVRLDPELIEVWGLHVSENRSGIPSRRLELPRLTCFCWRGRRDTWQWSCWWDRKRHRRRSIGRAGLPGPGVAAPLTACRPRRPGLSFCRPLGCCDHQPTSRRWSVKSDTGTRMTDAIARLQIAVMVAVGCWTRSLH